MSICVNKACGKNTFGQNDSCPFCGTKQPNKMKRGSTKNQRALDKGASLGLAQFAAVELGGKVGPPKPKSRLSSAEEGAAVEAAAAPVAESEATDNAAEGATAAEAIEFKKPAVNQAGMALAAALKGGVLKKTPPKTTE